MASLAILETTLAADAATAGMPAVVTQQAKAATYVVAAEVAGVGRLAAAVVEIVVDGKATSAYFASIRGDASTLVRANLLRGTNTRPELIRLGMNDDYLPFGTAQLMLAIPRIHMFGVYHQVHLPRITLYPPIEHPIALRLN
jgi:hypothetical protein